MSQDHTNRFKQAMQHKDTVILAGGYLFEVERRGYLTAGEFVPKVALEHPDVLEQVTRDFVRAGSDVALAFTYNGHREKMRIIGEEHNLEPLNRAAMRIARKVAEEETEALGRPIYLAGNISNSNIYDPEDDSSHAQVRAMYREMVGWAKEEGAELIVAETMYYYGEAKIALEEIHAAGLPAVMNVAVFATGVLRDGITPAEACRRLAEDGAEVVGTNCFRGPETMQPVVHDILDAVGDNTAVCAMPAGFRTTHEHPTFFNLPDEGDTSSRAGERTFPDALEAQNANRHELADFARDVRSRGANVIGICCGASVIHHRALAEALGRETYLSRYSPDMSKHFMYGSDDTLKAHITEFGEEA